MADRKPLVIVSGQIQELPATDTLRTAYAATFHTNVTVWNGYGGDATNVAVGDQALSSASLSGGNNTASGANALRSNTNGVNNTASGANALYSNTAGNYNTASGGDALYSNTTGSNNTASGVRALNSNTNGGANTASGVNALRYNTTGDYNTASGVNALSSNTTGNYNTASGWFALYDLNPETAATDMVNGTVYRISVIGSTDFTLYGAASNTLGLQFTANGAGTGTGKVGLVADNNTAVGYNTGRGIVSGDGNTILGANVAGLAAGLTNNIILAIGTGDIKAQYNGTSWTLTGGVSTSSLATSGTGIGLDVTNANSTAAQQLYVRGSMTYDNTTIAAAHLATTISGGATSTFLRGIIQNHTYTPSANTTIQNILNQFSLNNTASATAVYGVSTTFVLGASALGGTISSYIGNASAFSPNAAATTNITTWTSYQATNIADGALMTVGTAYAFNGLMASGTNRWNCYMSGTAPNYFAGYVHCASYIKTTAPVTKTADFAVADAENYLINNKSGSTCTVTLPAASSYTGRSIKIKTIQAQTVVSASSNVIPLAGGAAGTAILAATAGSWAELVSNGTNWEIMGGA